jgi:hypothetical protein
MGLRPSSADERGSEEMAPGPSLAWRPSEQWVWQCLCESRIADFNARDGTTLDPSDPTGWDDTRVVSAAFLETVLLREPYRGALRRQGVRLVGAWFKEGLDLENARLGHELSLDGSRFEREVQLSDMRSAGVLSFAGSYFGRSLAISRARIEGQLNLSGARCTGLLNLNRLEVKGSLFMHTEGDRTAQFAEVHLVGARIEGQLVLRGARCTGPLVLESLQVISHVFLEGVEGDGAIAINMMFARLSGNLYLDRLQVTSLDLTGATLQGELHLGAANNDRPRWTGDAQFILRNATIGALQCPPGPEAWPALELGGCAYRQLGGLSPANPGAEMAARPADWFVDWLAKDQTFTPQPYHQLAGVLRSMGHPETADAVLYAGKERERRDAGWRTRKWWGMSLLKWTIGYGYGYRYFWSLIWVAGITLLGALILGTTLQGPDFTFLRRLAYSFDLLLPIVELDKRHSLEAINGWPRYYFYVHELWGYVLGSFIVAGLAGITKK